MKFLVYYLQLQKVKYGDVAELLNGGSFGSLNLTKPLDRCNFLLGSPVK